MKTPALALAAVAAAILSASAVPAMADAPKSGTAVTVGDLDLGTASGRYELSKRFDQAAREKCGIPDGQAPKGNAKYCYKNASKEYQMFAADMIAKHEKNAALASR